MIKTCENCPKHSGCTSLCKDLEKLLEPMPKNLSERQVPTVKRGWSDGEEDEEPSIDDLITIDPGRMFEDVADTEIDWTQTPPQPESADFEKQEKISLAEAIKWAIPKNNLKLKRRFNAFLRCSKIVEIASTANTTKQNVQKQFQIVIKKVGRILKKVARKLKNIPLRLSSRKKQHKPQF
jgi:hypothetical protein